MTEKLRETMNVYVHICIYIYIIYIYEKGTRLKRLWGAL